jgi:lipid II:glycine glycyltransferase (peptidoglycan interpeptide bridge formation enzyme)
MRKSIRTAEKNNVNIEINTDELSIRKAYDVIKNCSKARARDIPELRWWESLHEEFADKGQIVSAIAYHGSTPISAYLFIGYDKKINAISSGSLPEGYRLRVNHLLNFKVIEWAKQEKYKLLDMGGTNPHAEEIRGIDQFKADFGGTLHTNYVLEKQSFYFPLILRMKKLLNI